MDELRVRLIEHLCRLPQRQLAEVDALFRRLEGQPSRSMQEQAPGPAAQVLVLPHEHWPDAPVHRLAEHGTFMVTASTVGKEHFFRGDVRLNLLEDRLLRLAQEYDVTLEAWAVFSNHYHFVAHTSGSENQLATFIAGVHSDTATAVNRLDQAPGRAVWFNYWDTQLTFETSYLARLQYVHYNAVKHRLVRQAST